MVGRLSGRLRKRGHEPSGPAWDGWLLQLVTAETEAEFDARWDEFLAYFKDKVDYEDAAVEANAYFRSLGNYPVNRGEGLKRPPPPTQ